MTVRELINKLLDSEMDMEVKIEFDGWQTAPIEDVTIELQHGQLIILVKGSS